MKKEKYNYLLLTILSLFLIFIFIGFDKMLGSYTDWINQHTIFPEYFRNLFYETKEFIPNFAFQYGGGQNIFNLSYYGLLNPFILLSYLFPFIKMVDFITIINALVVVSSTLLFYKWLRNQEIKPKLALLSSIIFLCATPLIFHTHRHIMFISYMPFMILGLFGVDRFFKKKGSLLLLISVFLMIMTSYYYSVSGILGLIIYGVYCYFKQNSKGSIKDFFKTGFRFMLPIIGSVLLTAFFLLPTLYAITSGRNGSIDRNVWGYLFPSFNIKNLLYDAYSFGLIGLFFMSLVYFLKRKTPKQLTFMSVAILLLAFFPILVYFLNGGLYARPKVLIPLVPLGVYLITLFLEQVLDKKIEWKHLTIMVIVGVLIVTIFGIQNFSFYNLLFIADVVAMLVAIYYFYKYHNEKFIYGSILFVCVIMFFSSNCWEEYIKRKDYNMIFSQKQEQAIRDVLKQDKDFYRFHNLMNSSYTVNKIYDEHYYQTSLYSSTYNDYYHNFYYRIFKNANPYYNNFLLANTKNILFDTFMGVKYVASDFPLGLGYRDLGNGIYENAVAFPMMYATSNLMGQDVFSHLTYPSTIEALLQNVIVSSSGNASFTSHNKPYDLTLEQLGFQKTDKGYFIEFEEEKTITISLPKKLSKELLLLSFEVLEPMSCEEGDLDITINNITNKLTCKEWIYPNKNKVFHYVINEENAEKLTITFAPGTYLVDNLKAYTLEYSLLEKTASSLDPFLVDWGKTKGDKIGGTIEVKEDGYFVTSIPYDEGFTILVDGEKVPYEKVNTSFVGFPITKGKREIEIIYQAPRLQGGKIISTVTLFSIIGIYGGSYLYKKKKSVNK